MSFSRRYRDQPVQPVSRTPSGTAYACFTDKGYTIARDAFHSKFLSLTSRVGPWAGDTLTTLYNYLIATIKLCNYGEAEEQSRYILGLMQELRMGEEHCFICLECILAASYFLSGKLDDAERLFENIKQRGKLFPVHVKGQFDVLSLVRLTTKDCLVFWDSPLKLSVLIPVTDYVNQLEGKRPPKGLIRTGIGSLRRIRPLKQRHSPADSSGDGMDDAELRTLRIQKALHQATAMFDFGFEKRYTRSKLSMRGLLEENSPPGPIVNDQDVVAAEIRSDVGEFGDVIEANDLSNLNLGGQDDITIQPVHQKVAKWIEDQRQRPPMPDQPLEDAAIALTYRSMETTSSSLNGQKPQNQLEITLWPDDVPSPREKLTLSALLDAGAGKTCMSDECAKAIRAPIKKEEIQMITANGQKLEVLGSVRIGFMWDGPSGSKVTARVKCYVVRDLQVAILFCANIISKLRLTDSSSLLAPILLGARSKPTKHSDAQRSKQIANVAKANEQHEAELRKAERAKLEQQAVLNNQNQKPRATVNSLLGGSSTSVSSSTSSFTRFDRSTTTASSDESTKSGTSMDSQRLKDNGWDNGQELSKAVDSSQLRDKQNSTLWNED